MNTERSLYVIPIAHSPADMGHLRDQIPISEKAEAAVTKYWVEVARYVRGTFINGGVRVNKIYQDSLPNTDPRIVDRVIQETQTGNFDILRALRGEGSIILGTEDPDLLGEEMSCLQAIFNAPNESLKRAAQLEYAVKSALLLDLRDDYIFNRINQTLLSEELGILFIGAIHDVSRRLRSAMCVIEPKELIAKFPRDYLGIGEINYA